MKILLVYATKFELAPLLKNFNKIRSEKNIRTFRFKNHTIDVLLTGVGMTATSFHLGKILNNKYKLAINTGIAGSFKKTLPPGTVVNVTSDCFSDLGAEDGNRFLTAEEMGLVASYKLKVASLKAKQQTAILKSLPKVKGITVNTVHGNTANIKKVVRKFNPDVESMEGASFIFACNHENISCMQIRAISNYVEKRNKKNWKMDMAIRNLNLFLHQFLDSI